MYLQVLPIVRTAKGLAFGSRGRVVEWLLQMRRMPESLILERLLDRGAVTRRHMRHIADRLVPFFRAAPRSRRIARHGSPQQVARRVLENLEEARPLLHTLVGEQSGCQLEAAKQG